MSRYSSPRIVNQKVEDYLEGLLRPVDKVLSRLEKDAEANSVPIVGRSCANLLALIANGCKAKNILEIGTATGYSGIWLGQVAKRNSGKLITVEMDPDRRAIAERSFSEAGLADSIQILHGDARAIVPNIAKEQRGKFDLVFLDVGNKRLYVELLEHAISAIRIGGYLIADNTLWRGSVAYASDKSPEANAMRTFNKLVYEDKRLLPVIIPLRDGVTIALKVSK